MDSKTEVGAIRQLIADNQNRQAAERLYQWFEGKSAGRQDAALGLLNRVTALNDNVLRGLISQADADLERNRITNSLLELVKQLDDTGPLPAAGKPFPVKVSIAVVVVLAAIVLGWLGLRKGPAPPPSAFDLTVNLHGPGGESDIIRQGRVKLVLGDYNLPPRDVNSDGQAFFDKIPGEFFDKPVKLVPLEMRYSVTPQSVRTPAESRSITFQLTPLPDTTVVRGIVFLPGPGDKPASGARLDFNAGQAEAAADEKGQFHVPVPGLPGAKVKLMIEYKGQNRYNRDVTLPSGELLQITLTQ